MIIQKGILLLFGIVGPFVAAELPGAENEVITGHGHETSLGALWAIATSEPIDLSKSLFVPTIKSVVVHGIQSKGRRVSTYKSHWLEEKDAVIWIAENFKSNLEKANYEVVRFEIVKYPNRDNYAFEIDYRAKEGFEEKPLQTYQSEWVPSWEAAREAMNAWIEQNMKNEFVPLMNIVRSDFESNRYSFRIIYAYRLKHKE